ncbi:methyltransferase [Nocardioides jensenii]|uniref:methyltransferase n=1 Tax=Nocardioides jensenii TaxID=1843 RepID=UPI000830148A|nr:methyltransferase [Nocardioides jensenii]
MTTPPAPAELDTARGVRALLIGKLLSQSLTTFAELGVAELLDRRPMTGDELADALDADPQVLTQLLRALVPFDVVCHHSVSDRFSLGSLGAALRRGVPGSAYASALLAGGPMGRAWSALTESVRTGRPAFEVAHGVDLFTALDSEAGLRRLFHESQEHDLELSIESLLRVIDVPEEAVIMDVGGGEGAFLERLTTATGAEGILMDTPATVEGVPARRRAHMRVVPGDFFDSVPTGADVVVLRDILHDWGDEAAARILTVCREAIVADGRILVVERTLSSAPESTGPLSADSLAPLMDLYMVTVLGGRERSVEDYRALATKADLVERAMAILPDGTMVLELGVC